MAILVPDRKFNYAFDYKCETMSLYQNPKLTMIWKGPLKIELNSNREKAPAFKKPVRQVE
ncbi:hypothetical protein [Paraflavitalea speifideaquila]|uniref:hypothetical protein n=1 Tax=Paraflavitalea speifideaquila TaxID=3076558 RepID=UPI0028E284E2|nr:hypothetical protein [Paraflavitalea speifideiaquila]